MLRVTKTKTQVFTPRNLSAPVYWKFGKANPRRDLIGAMENLTFSLAA